jgi:hypothetical protein
METGKVKCAPDYKSKSQVKRIAAQKRECSMCGEDHAAVAKQRDAQRAVADKHKRLRAAVIDAVRKWHHNDKGFTRIPIHLAMDALIAFEAEHKIGE